ncbi:hypothetical protein CUMW_177750 [Citrus unshiu]|uniref:Uncharacterized protein n=1 Tax=Citrus unshiu TaxID=55188 RepID=A0A2H5PY02_CITUN|nr:hypothetical protein CUMW_177750 [Citrus unshiu]
MCCVPTQLLHDAMQSSGSGSGNMIQTFPRFVRVSTIEKGQLGSFAMRAGISSGADFWVVLCGSTRRNVLVDSKNFKNLIPDLSITGCFHYS